MTTLQQQINVLVDEHTQYDDGPCGSYANGHDIAKGSMLLVLSKVQAMIIVGEPVTLTALAALEADIQAIEE